MKKLVTIVVVAAAGVGVWLVTDWLIGRAVVSRLPELPALDGRPKALAEHLRAADRAARARPDDAGAVGALGRAYHADVFYQRARACYRLAMELAPDDWRWFYHDALVLEELGANRALLERLRQVVDMRPDMAIAWYRLGQAALKLGRGQEAHHAFERAVAGRQPEPGRDEDKERYRRVVPVAVYGVLGLARLAYRAGEFDEAERLLGRLVRAEPGFGPAHKLLGRVHRARGRNQEAAVRLGRAAQLSPYHPPSDPVVDELARESHSSTFLLKQMGLAEHRRDSRWAEVLGRRAMQVDPDDIHPLSSLGMLLLHLGRPDEALGYLDRYLERAPDDYQTMNNACVMLRQQGRIDTALGYCRAALAVRPDCVEALGNLGMILAHQKKTGEARKLLERALSLDPDNVETLTNLGTFWARQGDAEKAKGFYQKALAQDEVYATARYGLGVLLAAEGDWLKAREHLRVALEVRPADARAAERLAWLLATCPDPELRDGERALVLAERAVRLTGGADAGALDTLAAAQAERGLFDKAVKTAGLARERAAEKDDEGRIQVIDARLELYRQGKPYRSNLAIF